MNDIGLASIPQLDWVFAYGSLIWRPGFAPAGSEPALLVGAHRSLCIYSHLYRGTPDVPGLVFGLEAGGACQGVGFRIDPANWTEVCAYLWAREQVNGVYRPSVETIELANGDKVSALTFLADATHKQYAGKLTLEEQVTVVRSGFGTVGSNVDYVLNTAQHLEELGIADPNLRVIRSLLLD